MDDDGDRQIIYWRLGKRGLRRTVGDGSGRVWSGKAMNLLLSRKRTLLRMERVGGYVGDSSGWCGFVSVAVESSIGPMEDKVSNKTTKEARDKTAEFTKWMILSNVSDNERS